MLSITVEIFVPESGLSNAMKRYRESLASRGVRQIQTNLPDPMVDWIDELGAEKGLNRSSMIEVLCRLGAARLDEALSDEPVPEVLASPRATADGSGPPPEGAFRPRSLTSVIAVAPPGNDLGDSLLPSLAAHIDTHILFVSTHGGRPLPDRTGVVLEWRASAPTQGHRFNPLSPSIMPKDREGRRLYVRWVAQVLAPERGEIDAGFPDSTRQLIEETISALAEDGEDLTLEGLGATVEAMPWPPAGGAVPSPGGRRVIDILATTHKGLAPFASRDDKSLTSAVEAARDALAPFTTPELRRLTASDDNILAFFDGPPRLVQVLDAGLRTPVSRLATMLVVAAMVRQLRTKPYSDRPPLIIALDDLGSLPRIPGLEEAVTIGSRHGLAVVARAQSFRQIEARYGEATALSIRAAARVLNQRAGKRPTAF